MKQFRVLATAFAAALLVAACGGGGDGDQSPAVKYASVVSFGDSLSDIGTYKVGTVAALGGGMYSMNGVVGSVGGDPVPSKNWTDLVAAQAGVSTPCAAQTGLDGDPTQGFFVPVVNHAGCFNYAQGGARVTNPVGPGNKLLGGGNAILGQLTVPITTQIDNHLSAVGGSFSGTELVTVMAGGNDVLEQLGELGAAATAAGQAAGATAGAQAFVTSLTGQLAADATAATAAADISGAFVAAKTSGASDTAAVTAAFQAAAADGSAMALAALIKAAGGDTSAILAVAGKATTDATIAGTAAGATAGAQYAATNGPALIPKMATAGTELAGYINTKIVGKGAKHVVVVNLPDVSLTPAGTANPSTQPLILAMVNAFNGALQAGLVNSSSVISVDAFAENQRQVNNPGHYALTSVTNTACNISDFTKNPLGSSLVCNASNLNTGDVSHYLFADTVHPTPYGYKLLAQYVTKALVIAGWL
jgi:phospholipase/lecithinase/hemolysin